MEGPYRDLGAGFARLTGPEGARRSPSPISHVEDALTELLRNARDARARHIFVASSLTRRRFRTLTVIDDGRGIPEPYADLIFEPGVTTRHLDPVRDPANDAATHGAGLSLYHIREAALSADVMSPSTPTAIRATFDTLRVPERSLQSETRRSNSNLLATLRQFVRSLPQNHGIKAYYGPPAAVFATLLKNHIIHVEGGANALRGEAGRLGLGFSLRTAHRVMRGEVAVLDPLTAGGDVRRSLGGRRRSAGVGGPVLGLNDEETNEIADILRRAARGGYLEVEDLKVRSRPGEISLSARVYEPEDEYE